MQRLPMKIEFYKSALCPRCAYASHILKTLQAEEDGLEIITYDILTDFTAFRDAGIKMIPAIRCGNNTQSWVLPAKDEIRDFILKNR